MPKAARNLEPAPPDEVLRPAKVFKKLRFNVFLVTGDYTLWPLVGADLSADLILKQLDSVDELHATVPSGQAGIVLWDARGHANPSAELSKLNMHSTRFAVVVLDSDANSGSWAEPLQHRQIVAHVGLPLSSVALGKALESAREEIGARLALLGDQSNPPALPAKSQSVNRWVPIGIGAVLVVLAGAAAFLLMRGGGSAPKPAAGIDAERAPQTAAAGLVASGKAPEAMDEKLDALIEKAQQAMLERHFIDPAAGSALSLYRDVLLVDPNNGEARQGLQRLEEILIVRVQAALDERKFDLALQSLETARSINPNDRRLAALDEHIASLRAELGPVQITAALNAQNFDRASQLIDDASRAKSLPAAKLTQLRDDLHKRRDEADTTRVLKLIDTRMQQGELVDPRNDSVAFYLEQARRAGVPQATLQATYLELQRQLALAVRGAIDAKHFSDADHWLAEMRDAGASNVVTAGLQKDLTAARSATAAPKVEQPQVLDLAQTRPAQGKLLEPDNASDAGDTAKAQAMLQAATGPGASPNVEALSDKLQQKTAASAGPAAVPNLPEQSLTRLNKLEVVYPERALERGVEGWVEMDYTVNPDGSVSDVTVENAVPANLFDQAGVKAVSKLRYQPVMQAGKPVAVTSKLRVVFRMPK
jgi:protein TonB